MSETPHVDAAIRAGCEASQCVYPTCMHSSPACKQHLVTLRAAFPWTPSAETIEAMAFAFEISGGDPLEDTKAGVLDAYRAIPIVRELWPDLAGAEPPGDV